MDIELIEQIVWLFANACGNSTEIREIILKETNILEILPKLIQQKVSVKIFKTFCWFVANISRAKGLTFDQVI